MSASTLFIRKQSDYVTQADAGEWSSSPALIHLAREAVGAVNWPHKESRYSYRGQSFAAPHLMILAVYCYARGVYGSQAVEEVIRKDPLLREFCPEDKPEAALIRRFRRDHREPIKECLLYVFDRAFLARFGEPDTEAAPIDSCVAQALDRWFEPICGPLPTAEAEERIDRAIFWDGMAAS